MNSLTQILAFCSAVMLLAGCSHTKYAYIHPSLTASNGVWAIPRAEKIQTRLVLVGDAGNHDGTNGFLDCLRSYAAEVPTKTVVIFLGDNVYEKGLPQPDKASYREATNRLSQQLRAADPAQEVIFIPGNHDWKSGADGVKRQQLFVQAAGRTFYPSNESYAPVVDNRFPKVRLVALDSEQLERSTNSGAVDEAMKLLQAAVANAGERHVVVLAHHPLATHGIHGGFFDWKRWLFNAEPFRCWGFNIAWLWVPVPGPYVAVRTLKEPPEDLHSAEYRRFVAKVTAALQNNKPLVYAAGHDHNLQVLDGGLASEYMLVSGFGSPGKETTVTHGDDTFFAHLQPGFMVLDFLGTGEVLLRVIEPGIASKNHVVFSQWLRK